MADTPSDPNTSTPSAQSRRKGLTPEQRRTLATPKEVRPPSSVKEDEVAAEQSSFESEAPTSEPMPPLAEEEPSASSERREPSRRGTSLSLDTPASRTFELRQAILVLGLLAILAIIFYGGTKYHRVRYFIETRLNPDEFATGPEKFPDLSADDLVETALAAEKTADWADATTRFIEAKRKNRGYQGILFRVGKSAYDRGDFAAADEALGHALRFGENVAIANQLRGMIAVQRHDLAAAERFFTAAVAADPFAAEFRYLLGETLRLSKHPRDAIRRYQEALTRTPNGHDASLCEFKIRLGRIEAAEASAVAAEVEEKRKAGSLPVPWLMTDAALHVHHGRIPEAAQAISEARSRGVSGLFLTCSGDSLFRRAGDVHPEIARLLGPVGTTEE